MRCHICDAPLNNINYNSDHQDFNPCGTCLAVIAEVFPAEEEEPRTIEETAEIEPTAEEMMKDSEDLAFGRIDVV